MHIIVGVFQYSRFVKITWSPEISSLNVIIIRGKPEQAPNTRETGSSVYIFMYIYIYILFVRDLSVRRQLSTDTYYRLWPDHLSTTAKIEVRMLSWLLGGVGQSHHMSTCIRTTVYSKVLA